MDLLTLEDINTWILKYRFKPSFRYRIPVIEPSSLYIGKDNQMSDVIGLPSSIDYTVYYHNKPITSFYVPVDDYDDTYKFRVVTKSVHLNAGTVNSRKYVDSDVEITIPVSFKQVESVNDFNNYNYIILDDDIEDSTFVIDGDVKIFSNDKTFNNCNITVNGNVIIEGNITLTDTIITVNGSLTFENGKLEINNANDDYSIVNNNNVIINNTRLDLFSGLCINNQSLQLINSNINPLGTNISLIYDRGSYEIKSNVFNFSDNYDEFGLCILRTNNIDTLNLFTNNTFNYSNVVLTLSGVDYNISGNGFAYTIVHKDDIKLYELRV